MNPELVPVPELDHYELVKHFSVALPEPLGACWVPAGFHYDGASIPTAAWHVIYSPFAPDVMRAALAHDWLYHAHEDDELEAKRRRADDILYAILEADGVSKFKREVMWSAVRNFGGPYWENDDRTRVLVQGLYQQHKKDPDVDKFCFPSWAKV